MTKHLGFTGTHYVFEDACRTELLKTCLQKYQSHGYGVFHHGDCVGSDSLAHIIALDLGYRVVIHPPQDPKLRAYSSPEPTNDISILEPRPYLERNRAIVDSVEQMIAVPRAISRVHGKVEVPRGTRSGTWYTVRYALKQKCPVKFV